MTRNNPAFGALGRTDWLVKARLTALEAKLKAEERAPDVRATAAAKVSSGALLTRAETAAYLSVSTKKIQRMQASGQLPRCPGLGGVVRYSARDVLRLASASSRKGA